MLQEANAYENADEADPKSKGKGEKMLIQHVRDRIVRGGGEERRGKISQKGAARANLIFDPHRSQTEKSNIHGTDVGRNMFGRHKVPFIP